jgi:hypothetical protein
MKNIVNVFIYPFRTLMIGNINKWDFFDRLFVCSKEMLFDKHQTESKLTRLAGSGSANRFRCALIAQSQKKKSSADPARGGRDPAGPAGRRAANPPPLLLPRTLPPPRDHPAFGGGLGLARSSRKP